MALKGNLRDFTVTQLFNLINLAQKSGTLVVEGPSIVRAAFREGKLSYVEVEQEDASLAGILRRNKKIGANQYRLIKERATHMSDKELGLLLINAGYISQDDIFASLQQYFIDVIRHMFTWVEGLFRFEPEVMLPRERIAVRMDLENLIIEGSRQLREREYLQEEIPSLEMALKFTNRPGANIRDVKLTPEEWRVVSYVNPKNSIKMLAKASKMSEIEIRKVVYSLLQAGLVEMVRPVGMTLPAISRAFPTTNRVEQASLVNRLITRIRSI